MDDGAPALGVGFEIDTASAFGNLSTLDDAIGKAAADAVRDFQKIEAASKSAVNLAGATAQVTAFANAETRELANVARARNAAEKAGEGMVRQMQRQVETYGKTAAEIRNMRAEMRALAAEEQGLTELAGRIRSLDAEMNRLESGAGGVTNAAVKNRQAMQGASYQVQDFITQVSMGANPVNAFAVQGAQLAGQFSNVEGKAGNVARFFMGPWGLAITAGLMVLGPFVGKLLESNDALKDAEDKLKKDAAATEANRKAKEAFARTLEGVIDAMKRQNEEFEKSIQTQRDMAIQGAANARVRQADYERNVTDLKNQMDAAKTAAQVARDIAALPGADAAASAVGIARAEAKVAELAGKLKAARAQAAGFALSIRQADSALASMAAKAATDPIGAINARFDQQAADATRAAVASGKAQDDVTKALTRQLVGIEMARKAAIKAEEDKQKAVQQTTREIGRNIDVGDARRIAQSVGGTVTSDLRNRQEQERLYARYQAYKAGTGPWAAVAAKPGTSNHEMGQAIDVAKTRGVTLAKLIAAFKESGVRITEALDEGSHFHIAWAKVGDAARQQTQERNEAAKVIAEQKREMEAAVKAATDYADAQKKAAEQTGLSAKQVRMYADAAAIAKAPTDALRYAIAITATAREKAISDQAVKDVKDQIKDIELETKLTRDLGEARLSALRGLSGQRLDDALADIATAHAKAAIQAKAEADAAEALKDNYFDLAAAILAKAEADKTQVDVAAEIDRQNAALERQMDIVSALGSRGPMSGLLGALMSNNPIAGIANLGPLGSLASLATSDGRKAYQMQGKIIADSISDVFGVSGPFSKTLASALQGSSIGSAVGSIMGGGKGSQLGSSIGGALGEVAGKKLLSSLGSFAGPLGGIVGGLLGGVLGGLIGKPPPPSGTATITNGNIGISGTDSSRKQAAGQMANSVTGGLSQIAKALGATLGDYNVALGQYKDEFRVNFSGSDIHGVKRTAAQADRQTYSTAEAAVRAALADAIKDGAIQGISASKSAILKAGTDIDTQLDRVMQFQNVFDEVKKKADPLGFAMDQLAAQEANLRDIFKQASATTAEYAQLEQYLADQRQAALDEDAQRQLEKLNARRQLEARLMTAQGDAAGALAVSRQIELSQTDAALRALMQQIYAAEDAQQATAAAAQAADELRQAWKSVGDGIMDEVKRIRGLSDTTGASAFAALQGQFNAATLAARGGDQEAAKLLPQLSQSLLTAAAETARSRQELDRVRAQTAASLEATYGMVRNLAGLTPTSNAALLDAGAASQAGNASANDNATNPLTSQLEQLRTELAGMRADMNSRMAANTSASAKTAQILDRVTAESGGESISVALSA
jgi:hypothetical protein